MGGEEGGEEGGRGCGLQEAGNLLAEDLGNGLVEGVGVFGVGGGKGEVEDGGIDLGVGGVYCNRAAEGLDSKEILLYPQSK